MARPVAFFLFALFDRGGEVLLFRRHNPVPPSNLLRAACLYSKTMLRRREESILLYRNQSVSHRTPLASRRDVGMSECRGGGSGFTSRRYSPTSACLKHTIPVGSSLLASAVDRAVTPNPCEKMSCEMVTCSFFKFYRKKKIKGMMTDQWHIIHSQHDDTLMFGAIFAPPAHVRFDDVSPVLYFFPHRISIYSRSKSVCVLVFGSAH